MPSIWDDVFAAQTNVTRSNNQSVFRFNWHWVTFTNERPVEVWVRWRKANCYPNGNPLSIRDRIRKDEGPWTGYQTETLTKVYRQEDTTTWVLQDIDPNAGVDMQYVPPAENLRKYTSIYHVDYPLNTFSDGFYIFDVSIRAYADSAGTVIPIGDAEAGWTTHRLEINSFDDIAYYGSSSTGQTKGPGFDSEGKYSVKVEVMSEAGVTSESGTAQFDVWETNLYTLHGGMVQAVPESRVTANGTLVRVRRT